MAEAVKKKRPPRWGLRTIGCLVLAIVALLTAGELGGHTPGTLGCTVLGIGGAIYCSVKGIRNADLRPRREPPPEHLDADADRWNTGAAPSPSTDEPTTETDR